MHISYTKHLYRLLIDSLIILNEINHHSSWDAFINQCNLACSSVYASRDIDKGEELIVSFGDVTPTGFAAKYGEIPLDFLHHWDVVCDVQMWCPPKFIPTDKLRMKCLEKSDYPLDILSQTKGGTALISLQPAKEPVSGDNVDF